jgi:hypothetical protein
MQKVRITQIFSSSKVHNKTLQTKKSKLNIHLKKINSGLRQKTKIYYRLALHKMGNVLSKEVQNKNLYILKT